MIRFADIVTDPKGPDAKAKKASASSADGKPPAAQVPAPAKASGPKAPRKPKASS